MKLLERIIRNNHPRDCQHSDAVQTSIHGLDRTVCLLCGHVTIAQSEPVVTEARPIRHRY